MVAVPAHDVWTTATLTSAGVADAAERALRVALTRFRGRDGLMRMIQRYKPSFLFLYCYFLTHGSFVQQSGDAEDVVVTDVGHGAFNDALAALQTAVTLERVPRSFTFAPVENIHLTDPRNQHQLRGDEEEEEEHCHKFIQDNLNVGIEVGAESFAKII